MELKWGSYGFGSNATKVVFSSRVKLNDGGQPVEINRRLDADGFIQADGQAAIAAAAAAMVTALSVPYQDLILYRDDGTASDTKLLNAGSLSGVVIKDLRFPDSRGGEYSTFRRFTFSAEADYPVLNSLGLLLSFHERLSFSGGGPIYRHKMAVNGRPQKQLVYPFSIFKATQEGEAVGFLSYPTPPPPKWPSALMQSPDNDLDTPQRRGRLYTDFRVSWRYNFESAVQLIGTPNVWKG